MIRGLIKSDLFRYSFHIPILILILVFSINMIDGSCDFWKNYMYNSGCNRNTVPSSNVAIINPELKIDFNSIPDGAWISIDGKNQSKKTPGKIKIGHPGSYGITLAYKQEKESTDVYINETLEKIEYNFKSCKWNNPYYPY